MLKITSREAELLTDEVLSLSGKLNNNILEDIDSAYRGLSELLQEIGLDFNIFNNVHYLNDKAYDLHQDTIKICDEIKSDLHNAQVIEDK